MNLPATGPNYSYLFDTESMSAWGGLLRLREQLENGLPPLTPRPPIRLWPSAPRCPNNRL